MFASVIKIVSKFWCFCNSEFSCFLHWHEMLLIRYRCSRFVLHVFPFVHANILMLGLILTPVLILLLFLCTVTFIQHSKSFLSCFLFSILHVLGSLINITKSYLVHFAGPISSPSEAEFILKSTKGVHGFYGASSMERLPVEQAITSTIQLYKSISIE